MFQRILLSICIVFLAAASSGHAHISGTINQGLVTADDYHQSQCHLCTLGGAASKLLCSPVQSHPVIEQKFNNAPHFPATCKGYDSHLTVRSRAPPMRAL